MSGKRIVVYISDERIYKALRHKCVNEGLTISNLVLKLIKQYLGEGHTGRLAPKSSPQIPEAPQSMGLMENKEATSWKDETRAVDVAMPLHTRPMKGPSIEPIERSIRG